MYLNTVVRRLILIDNVSLFDKITAIVAGGIILVFIVTLIICRVRYEWEREELDEYWKKCRDDDW
ncbi:hypothetical protein SAMN02745912_01167 [Paramaledivibacter caminithermalis DSM 15212]|jgi:phosphate starvation-inducible membrane PsiE|uniref:Uncharacterized protein n=1 Tax=Paramaledivibacter caminithermalis (strain DSM 15212 / CIP 107654 / DViRD3) TaxID=1121301 RepID=A0A1M6MCX2_PARC5|nr:hypothetical protein SAMN02745912_01167 [Paramaledivibacter caminithermalis DSM 15212]